MGDQDGVVAVARGVWTGEQLVDLEDVFDSDAIGTEASRIAFGRDGMMYVTVSAPGAVPEGGRAQDPSDYAGKVVRLTDGGAIPADNPFVHRAAYKGGIYTLGHRNGHALAVNPETGELWETEQGPNGGDELNGLKAGRNYGWPRVSYGHQYFGPSSSEHPWKKGYEDARLFWMPSIGVTGMTFYTGDRFHSGSATHSSAGSARARCRAPGSCSGSCSTTDGRRSAGSRCCAICIRGFETCARAPMVCCTC